MKNKTFCLFCWLTLIFLLITEETRDEGFLSACVLCLSTFFSGKKNHMAAGRDYQNLFPVYCSMKLLFLILYLQTKILICLSGLVFFMALAKYELLTAGLPFKEESFFCAYISGDVSPQSLSQPSDLPFSKIVL